MDIKFSEKFIYPIKSIYNFYSLDDSIAVVDNGKIRGINNGITYIKEKSSGDSIKVIVTDLITPYTLYKQKY